MELQVRAGYWTFQLVNTTSALSFTLFTEKCHRSLVKNSDEMLETFGFGPLQYEFLLNQVRGWNTALLAISLYGFTKGPSKDFFCLACLTSALTTFAHAMTGLHHTKEEKIRTYLQREGVNPYGPACLTGLLTLITGWSYLKSRE
jgi:hypothetical protein